MATTERQTRLLVAEEWRKIYQAFQQADFKSYDFETLRRTMVTYLREIYPDDFNDYVEEVSEGNKINYKLKNSDKIIPNFLVNKDEEDISFEDTFDALKIVGDFLDKTIVKPNNLNFPKTRFNFQNSLKLI